MEVGWSSGLLGVGYGGASPVIGWIQWVLDSIILLRLLPCFSFVIVALAFRCILIVFFSPIEFVAMGFIRNG